MKKFLSRTSLFTLILTFCVILLNVFHKNYNDDPPHYLLQYQESCNVSSSYNGVILGTSQATHGIRPSLIDSEGVKYFNLAFNGSSPEFYVDWYNHIFSKHHPKIDHWIISIDNYFLSGKGWRKLEQDSEYIPFHILEEVILGENTLDKKMLIQNRIPMIKHRSALKRNLDFKKSKYYFMFEDYDSGYLSLERSQKSELLEGNSTYKARIDTKSKQDLVELIRYISSSNTRITLIIPPEFKLSEYGATLAISEEFSMKFNLQLVDFNDARFANHFSSVELFCDHNHLNKLGSRVLSDLLAEELAKDRPRSMRKKN